MKQNNALPTIFAFFLGLLVLAFVAVALNTFLPEPAWTSVGDTSSQAARDAWQVTTGILLLVCATALLAASLFLPERQVVLSNGILLGGVFTMVYAVASTFFGDAGLLRFFVIAAALAVTIGIGYLRFVRGRRTKAVAPVAEPALAAAGVPFDLVERVQMIEHKLDAISAALRS